MVNRTKRRVMELPTESIRPNPMQPRQVFEEAALQELAASIAAHGILQPICVRRTNSGWEIVAGERRLRAAKLAGLRRVPCLETTADTRRSAALALVENLQRQDLHYFEEAAAIAAYIRESRCTQEEAAAALGRSPSALANKLRLLRLGQDCRAAILEHALTERHARALLRLEDEDRRLCAAQHIGRRHLNVAQAEQYIESLLENEPPTQKPQRSFILKDVRLFLNSVERGLRLVREAGVDAQTERTDTEDAILLTIRLPRRPSAEFQQK